MDKTLNKGRPKIHGHTHPRTPTYRAWEGLRRRCNSSKYAYYGNYGGRGITYDKRWDRFETFLVDMGICPAGKSIDRKNVNKGYYKHNCRWATPKEQSNNMRNNRIVKIGSLSLNVTQ